VVTVTLPCLLASTPSWTALFGPVTDEANLRVVRVLETEEGDPEMHFTVLVVERAWERRLPTRTRTRTLLPMVSGQPLGKDAAKRNRRQPVAKGFVHTVYKRETWLNENRRRSGAIRQLRHEGRGGVGWAYPREKRQDRARDPQPGPARSATATRLATIPGVAADRPGPARRWSQRSTVLDVSPSLSRA
jgi:hypothetical protein